jgi:hypothetical protein
VRRSAIATRSPGRASRGRFISRAAKQNVRERDRSRPLAFLHGPGARSAPTIAHRSRDGSHVACLRARFDVRTIREPIEERVFPSSKSSGKLCSELLRRECRVSVFGRTGSAHAVGRHHQLSSSFSFLV